MPFEKGNIPDNLDLNRYHMSIPDIAKELNTSKADIDYILRKAINKLRKSKYNHLQEYQYVEPETRNTACREYRSGLTQETTT